MSTVALKQTVDDREMAAYLTRTAAALDRLEGKLARVGRSGQRSGKETQDGFGGAMNQVTGFATAITGVGSGLQLAEKVASALKQELADIQQARSAAGDVQRGIAPARKEALLNLGVEDADLLDAAVDRSARFGARRADLYTAASGAVSFRGELSKEQALEAVDVAAQIDPQSADSMKTVAEGILTVQKVLDDVTAFDVAAFEQKVKSQAAVSTSQDFSANIATGIADLSRLGSGVEESGALLAYLTQGSGDTTGKSSRTGAIQFARQLQQAAPFEEGILAQLEAVGSSPELRRRLLGSMMEGQTYDTATRQAILAGEKSTAKGELTGEAKMMATFAQLLNSAEARGVLQQRTRELGTVQGSGAEFQAILQQINQSGVNARVEAVRAAEAVAEGSQVNNPAALVEQAKQAYETTIRNAGYGSWSDRIFGDDGTAMFRSAKSQVNFSREGAALTDTGVDDIEVLANRARKFAGLEDNPLQEQALRDLQETLNRLADEVRRAEESQRANTDATKENTNATNGDTQGQTSTSTLSREDG